MSLSKFKDKLGLKNLLVFACFLLCFSVVSAETLTVPQDNPFGLEDNTVIQLDDNSCYTELNDFTVKTYPCKVQDLDGKNIEQNIDFEWKQDKELQSELIMAYPSKLKNFQVFQLKEVEHEKSYIDYVPGIELKTYYNVTNVTSINETSEIITYLNPNYDISLNNSEYINRIINFISKSNSSNVYYYNISVVNTELKTTNYNLTEWVDVSEDFKYKGYDIFGHGYEFYALDPVQYYTSDIYHFKIIYTPSEVKGEFHIFGKPSAWLLEQAIERGTYVYQDPWWSNEWQYKRKITINSNESKTDWVFSVNLTDFDYANANSGNSLRILNSAEDTEVNFRIYNWNESGVSTLYLESNLSIGDNTFYLYYGNELASDVSDSSLQLSGNLKTENIQFTNTNIISEVIKFSKILPLSNGNIAYGYIKNSNSRTYIKICNDDFTSCNNEILITELSDGSFDMFEDVENGKIIFAGDGDAGNDGYYYYMNLDLSNKSNRMKYNDATSSGDYNAGSYISITDLTSTDFALTYRDESNYQRQILRICQKYVASCGSEINVDTSVSSYGVIKKTSDNLIKILYEDQTSNNLELFTGSLSGSEISKRTIESGGHTSIDFMEVLGKLYMIYYDSTSSVFGFRSSDLNGDNPSIETVIGGPSQVGLDNKLEFLDNKFFILSKSMNTAPYTAKITTINKDGTGQSDFNLISSDGRITTNVDMALSSSSTLLISYADSTNNKGSIAISEPLLISTSLSVTIGSVETQLTFSDVLISQASYLDLINDGTNNGRTSEGFAPGISKTFNLSSIDDSKTNILVFERTENDASFDIKINNNLIGTSPSYVSGSGDWIYEVYEISSSNVLENNVISIEAKSGNSETFYVDYLVLGNTESVANSKLSEIDHVIVYSNISSNPDPVDTVKRIITKQDGTIVLNDENIASKSTSMGTHLFIYDLPEVNEDYYFMFSANSSTSTEFSNSSSVKVEIDSIVPSINSIAVNLHSYVGELEEIILNVTDRNVNKVQLLINGTTYNFDKDSQVNYTSIWSKTISYTKAFTNELLFSVYDDVGHVEEYTLNVSVSNVTQNNSVWNFKDLFSYSNYISVPDTQSSYDVEFKVPITFTSQGNAFINDFIGTYDIIDSNPVNIAVELGDSSFINYSDNTINLSWTTDPLSNSMSESNNVYYKIQNAITTEWENTGVSNLRLFYIKSNNLVNEMKNVSVSIPLRTTYEGNSSSLDVFVCLDGADWVAKTCNQWGEITSELFNQQDLTYHHWGKSDYPTLDTNNDSKKDTLIMTIPVLSGEFMYKIDLDTSNAETQWAKIIDNPTTSTGGGGGGILSSLDDTKSSETQVISSSTVSSSFSLDFGGYIDAVFTWIGDEFSYLGKTITPMFSDPAGIMMLIFVGLLLVGVPLVSGSGSSKPKGVSRG